MRRPSLKKAFFLICFVVSVWCVFLSHNGPLFWLRQSLSLTSECATHGQLSPLKGSVGRSADDKSSGSRPHAVHSPKSRPEGRPNPAVQPQPPASARKDKGDVRREKENATDTGNTEKHPSAGDSDKARANTSADANKQPKGGTADAGKMAGKETIAGTSNSTAVWDPAMDSTMEELIKVSTTIFKEHGLVLFTVINDAYFQQTASWLCNVAPLGHVHPQLLFLSTDVATGRRLQSLWPAVRVVTYNGTAASFSGKQWYAHAGYVRLMMQRTRFIKHMLEADIRLLLFEVDTVWLADPLPTILKSAAQPGTDLVVVRVSNATLHNALCGCLILLKPTPASKTLWKRKTGMIETLYRKIADTNALELVDEKLGNDQQSLSHLISKGVGGVKAAYLPNDLFPDGRWYKMSPARRAATKPLIIHNNFIMGIPRKIRRSKKFGHWFILAAGNSTAVRCDVAAVNRIMGDKA